MFAKFLILFTIVPIAELYLLVTVGGHIGVLPTIGVVIATGLTGAALARSQGLKVLNQIQQSLRMGRMPGFELIEGAFVLTGGVLLLTPGFITDIFGILLMIPFIRRGAARLAVRYFKRQIQNNNWRARAYASSPFGEYVDSSTDPSDNDAPGLFPSNTGFPPDNPS